MVTPNVLKYRRSIDEAGRRITLHLQPYLSGRRTASITTDLLACIDQKSAALRKSA